MTSLHFLPSLTPSAPKVRAASAEAFKAMRRRVPALEVLATPAAMGRRARNFTEADDENLGQFKRACFEVSGVVLYLQCYRWADDGTMTLFVDVDACVARARSPLTVAGQALAGLGLGDARRTWVHTASEQMYWGLVDPHQVANALR